MTNESTKRKAIVDDDILRNLPCECRYFHDLIVPMLSNENAINAMPIVQVKKDLFTYDEDFEIHITMNDIIQFLSVKWLNSSWLQIYMM